MKDNKYVMFGNPKSKELLIPHLIIAPSYKCNIDCGHCYNNPIDEKVSLSQWKCFVDKWSNYNEGEKAIVHFKGGEPFCYGGLKDLLSHSSGKGLDIFITSNGTLIDDKWAGRLGEIYNKNGGKVILSLNGSNTKVDELLRPEGVYKKTIEAAKRLRRNEVAFDINYVVHSGNQHDISDAIQIGSELGMTQFNLLPLVLRGGAVKNNLEMANVNIILEQLKSARSNGGDDKMPWALDDMITQLSGNYSCDGCVAGFGGLAYAVPNGDVYSCPNTCFEEFKLGTINDSFEDLFVSDGARRLRESYKGKLVCKGELEEYKNQLEDMEKLLREEAIIKERIGEIDTKKKESQSVSIGIGKRVSLCFNRNY